MPRYWGWTREEKQKQVRPIEAFRSSSRREAPARESLPSGGGGVDHVDCGGSGHSDEGWWPVAILTHYKWNGNFIIFSDVYVYSTASMRHCEHYEHIVNIVNISPQQREQWYRWALCSNLNLSHPCLWTSWSGSIIVVEDKNIARIAHTVSCHSMVVMIAEISTNSQVINSYTFIFWQETSGW